MRPAQRPLDHLTGNTSPCRAEVVWKRQTFSQRVEVLSCCLAYTDNQAEDHAKRDWYALPKSTRRALGEQP